MGKITRQKVLDELQEEIKRIDTLSLLDGPQESEEYREPLSIDIIKEVKILLSWGGGEDGFKLRFTKENELIDGVYYLADWGEYEEIKLSDEEADKVFNFYLGGYFEG